MNISRLNNFQQRSLMSFIGIAYSSFVIYFSHTSPLDYLFVLTIALSQGAALYEYYTLSTNKGFQPLIKLPVIASIVYYFIYYALGLQSLALPFLFLFMAASFVAHFARYENSIGNLAVTAFGIAYITLPLSLLLDVNFLGSSAWFVYLLVTTKMADTTAYIAGKLSGKHLLAPKLSPKKTVEGAIGGLLGSVATSVAFFAYFQTRDDFSSLDITLIEGLTLGIIIGVISQIGDLAESLIKRDAQVKDSSKLPGFGGMLDVVDSLIFTTPLLYLWLRSRL